MTVMAYERHTGDPHVLELKKAPVGAPYIVLLDGSFLATADSCREGEDEIEATILWFGWSWNNPNFA